MQRGILGCTEIKRYDIKTDSICVVTIGEDGIDDFIVFVGHIPDLSFQGTKKIELLSVIGYSKNYGP